MTVPDTRELVERARKPIEARPFFTGSWESEALTAIAALAARVEELTEAPTFADGWLAAADEIAAPYGPDVFTPMGDDEIRAAVAAMNEAVPHASERMHAAWARHWADVLRAVLVRESGGQP